MVIIRAWFSRGHLNVCAQDGVPRTSLRTFARLIDQAVEALARGKLCKARVLGRNLRAKGRAKFQHRDAFRPLSDLPAECREALDR